MQGNISDEAHVEVGIEDSSEDSCEDGGQSVNSLHDVVVLDDMLDIDVPCMRKRVHFSVSCAFSVPSSFLGFC